MEGFRKITTADRLLLFPRTVIKLSHTFSILYSVVENWWDVILFGLGMNNGFLVRCRDGEKVVIKDREAMFDFWNTSFATKMYLKYRKDLLEVKGDYFAFNFEGKRFKFYCGRQARTLSTFAVIEEFLSNQYGWLVSNGCSVVDIGASVGDTPIYFAAKGAAHVYAFEPYPFPFAIGKKNIKANKLGKKIALLNIGCAGERKTVKIDRQIRSTTAAPLKDYGKGERVKIITLEDVARMFAIQDASLKVDCEGSEYGLILGSDDKVLRKFGRIMIEYHYGYLDLVDKLRHAGFKVRYEKPIRIGVSEKFGGGVRQVRGMISAERIEINK